MSWVHQTIADFGESIGIPTLSLGPKNRLNLALKSGKAIHLAHLEDPTREEVLVAMSTPLSFDYLDRLIYALKICDYRSSDRWTLHAGIADEKLILAVRVPQRDFSLPVLEKLLSQLSQFHDNAIEAR